MIQNGLILTSGSPKTHLKSILEPVAPSSLSISPWGAMGTLFMPISMVSEASQSGPVYFLRPPQGFPGKGEARPIGRSPNQRSSLPSAVLGANKQHVTRICLLVVGV